MKLAVMILNWNGREMLEKFLPSVIEHTRGEGVCVMVVDNGSSDGSVKWLRKSYPDVRLIEFQENYGYAGGYDRAIRMVDAEFVVLLNSDVEVPSGWWQPLLEFMETHPEAGAVQPKILSFRDKSRFEHAGAAGGMLDRYGYPFCRGRVLFKVEEDRGQYDSDVPLEVAWASGAAMMVRKSAFMEAGGLDPLFFAHMEEIDLCWRMRLAGYRVYVLTASRVYHLGGGSLAYGNPHKTYLNFRNNLLMLHKNLPQEKGRKFLFKRRLIDSLGFLFFLLRGKWRDAGAVLRAHRDFRKMKRNYTEFPDKDVMPEIPGTGRQIYKDYFLRRI